jgi:nucleoside 2-deoxyribosyltransferase
MLKIYLSHSSNYDYGAELYEPLKSSHVVRLHHFLFPHNKENIDKKSKSWVEAADLVLAEVSYPSTGQGIELGWANATGKRIICMSKSGYTVSGSLKFIADSFIQYTDEADMLQKIESCLAGS